MAATAPASAGNHSDVPIRASCPRVATDPDDLRAAARAAATTASRPESAFGTCPAAQCPENPVALCDGHGALLVAASEILVTATLDGGEDRPKIKQLRRVGCSGNLAEASSCSPAAGSSNNEVRTRGLAPARHKIMVPDSAVQSAVSSPSACAK